MPLSQFKNVVGSVTTAAVLCYSYLGAPAANPVDFYILNVQLKAPTEMNFDYYQLIDKDQAIAIEQIDVIHQFASNILDNIKDLEPEFSKTVDENFWDLI
jgi:predicted LPLAT superfamily acyltransferase